MKYIEIFFQKDFPHYGDAFKKALKRSLAQARYRVTRVHRSMQAQGSGAGPIIVQGVMVKPQHEAHHLVADFIADYSE